MPRNNEDFSHGSSYWKDKSYGDVAPDGTVHPNRAADRVGDARRAGDKYAGINLNNIPKELGGTGISMKDTYGSK